MPAETFLTVFTVRDMNCNTATVLAACRKHGRVIVKNRAGEQFAMTPVVEPSPCAAQPDFLELMRLHRGRIRAMIAPGPAAEDGTEDLNKIIAGDI